MTTETQTASQSGPDVTTEEKISQLRELFADAPEIGKKALENVLSRLASDASQAPPPPVESAGFLDIIDSAWEGWPGIRSPQAKDYLAKYQVTAEGWYVANDLTMAETRRLTRIGQAVDQFLDAIGD
jgi:hypothetical protein